MELDDLKAAWQEMSSQVAAQRRLTEKLVLDSIRQKSKDVIEDMRSGLECMPVDYSQRNHRITHRTIKIPMKDRVSDPRVDSMTF